MSCGPVQLFASPSSITLRIVQIDEETDSTLDAADVLSNVEEELADFVNTNGITLEAVGPTVPSELRAT